MIRSVRLYETIREIPMRHPHNTDHTARTPVCAHVTSNAHLHR
jgi:hypothetical protein